MGVFPTTCRLLYLISSYAPPDTTRWIREQSTSVFIYEGIVNSVLDYDYAPKSEHVQGALLFINVSQEGMDDLVDLREAGMLNMILLSTYQHNVRHPSMTISHISSLLLPYPPLLPCPSTEGMDAELCHCRCCR